MRESRKPNERKRNRKCTNKTEKTENRFWKQVDLLSRAGWWCCVEVEMWKTVEEGKSNQTRELIFSCFRFFEIISLLFFLLLSWQWLLILRLYSYCFLSIFFSFCFVCLHTALA